PIGDSGLTDDKGVQHFVGTLQYSSPEYLLRVNGDDRDSWRALTFYQIGGVMHDLIMRRPLFEEFTDPYARLVNAVQHEQPQVQNSAIPSYLSELARCCLIKDPKVRVRLVGGWERFNMPATSSTEGGSAKQRVTNRTALLAAQMEEKNGKQQSSSVSSEKLHNEVITFLQQAIRSVRRDNSIFPPIIVSRCKDGDYDLNIKFTSSHRHKLPLGLCMVVKVDVLEASTKAIALSAAAHIGSAPTTSSPKMYQFFQGLYDSSAIHSALETCAYEAIDKAQLISIEGDQEQYVWLKLDQKGS
ncbi:hypothetical protein P7L87_25155, partial [Vibrio parahaemolyticus]|nr:hypothetical protein [Vibrio parahaemolyticus]